MYLKIIKIIHLRTFSFQMTNMVIEPMKTKPQTTPMIIRVFISLLLLSALFPVIVVSDNSSVVLEVVFPVPGVLFNANGVISAVVLGVVVVDGGRSITVIVVCWVEFPTKEGIQEHYKMFQLYPFLSC